MRIVFDLKDGEQIMLRGDNWNYEICKINRSTNEETGQETENIVPFKFFQSLPQALNKLLDLKVRSSQAVTLKELADDLEAARSEIMSVWSTTIKGVKR